jgi:hypothetical protein
VGRPRRRWEGNIKMELGETRIDGTNWIRLAQHRVQLRAFVSTVMNFRVPCRKRRLKWVFLQVGGWSTGLATLSL